MKKVENKFNSSGDEAEHVFKANPPYRHQFHYKEKLKVSERGGKGTVLPSKIHLGKRVQSQSCLTKSKIRS